MRKASEREAKFHIEAGAAIPDLAGLPDGLTVVERPEVRLSARYFDTPALDLLQRGMTLRHRRDLTGAGEDLWTLKLPEAGSATVLARTELTWPGAEIDIPAEARRLLTAVVRDNDLRIVAAFVTVRRRREVHDGAGVRLAEVDDDRVTVTAPTAKVFRQIEVELDAGDAGLITKLTKLLERSGATRSDDGIKLRLALADRIAELDRAAPVAAPPVTLADLFQARLVDSFDKLVTRDIALRLERRTEDVHQARVACRRLRSDIKTFASILDGDWATEMAGELRWWGGVLGTVRDLDVFGRRIADHAGGPDDPDADGFAALGERIAAQGAAAWTQVQVELDCDRYRRLLDRLDAATVAPPLAPAGPSGTPAGEASVRGIGHLVAQPWRRLRRTVRALPAQPSDADLHRVRIRSKQLRYASESAISIVGAPAERLARAAEGLQTVLGDQHDAVVAEATLRSLAGSLDGAGAFVAGLCVAAERDAARSKRTDWPAAWQAVDDKQLRSWLTR